MPSTPPAATASPYLHTDPTDRRSNLFFAASGYTSKTKKRLLPFWRGILKASPLKRGQKREAKDTFTTEINKDSDSLILQRGTSLCTSFWKTILCAGSEVFTVEVFRLLVQSLPYRCSGNLWMCCHQRQSSHLKRSLYHSALMGCTSLQVTQEWNQNISNAIPSSTCLLVFFHHFSESTHLHEEMRRGKKKPVFCTLSFTVFNQLLQDLSQKVTPCTLKEERQLCAVQESKHSLKTEARSTLQTFASTAMSATNGMEHDLWLCLQRPLQYSYRSKTVTWLAVTLFFPQIKTSLE